ncbi:uncharacterized protein si:dkey-261l7.2 [Erpetoichthys calabaricus]|uniref:Si:dkey-261l7.2 n=1 Tax=Erpetoichthys calabaricus TaxID=27687 RepID=A0A8C4RNY4_ERPCA|nr:uncharacterized protein si:dkey-261l7.2 [Erpetoichthys calabaricus]
MPQVTPAVFLQLALLLSALPAQYLISQWTGKDAAYRYHATQRLIRSWNNFQKSYLNVGAVVERVQRWVSNVMPSMTNLDNEQEGESPAFEVLRFQRENGYFGDSREIRSPRPNSVLYRVGEVIMEKDHGMIGVIVGWDEKLKAPREWIEQRYSHTEGEEDVPHYKVLFGEPSGKAVMVDYIRQTALQAVTGVKPQIPNSEIYFRHYDGRKFIMQPWLKAIYPDD